MPYAHDLLRGVLPILCFGDRSLTSSKLPRAVVTVGKTTSDPTAVDTAAKTVVTTLPWEPVRR